MEMRQLFVGRIKSGDWRRPAGWFLGAALLSVTAFNGIRAFLLNAHAPLSLMVYAFSTQEEVFTQGIFPAFEQAWEAETGPDR